MCVVYGAWLAHGPRLGRFEWHTRELLKLLKWLGQKLTRMNDKNGVLMMMAIITLNFIMICLLLRDCENHAYIVCQVVAIDVNFH